MARVISFFSSAINSLLAGRGGGSGPAPGAFSSAFSSAFDGGG